MFVRRLRAAELGILARAWVLLAVTSLLLRVLPLRRVLSLRWPGRGRRLPAERVARLVQIAARHSVPAARCLPVAIVTAWLLGRQGTPATLRIGVSRHGDRLTAHAWLECQGGPLLDPSTGAYMPIAALSADAGRSSDPRRICRI